MGFTEKLQINLPRHIAAAQTYSHLKNLTAITVQIIATAAMTAMGNHMFPSFRPRKADFISLMPCVRGKTLTIFCIAAGMTSKGRVAPEKISIGKYNMHAITLALLEFFATPPTIIPMLSVEIIVSSQLPVNAAKEPVILTPQKSIAAGSSKSREARQYTT